jgi:hypothetical protein
VGLVLESLLARAPYAGRVDHSMLTFATRGGTTTDLLSLVLQSRLDLAGLHVTQHARTYASGEAVVDFMEASVPLAGQLRFPATVEGGDTVWLDERTLLVGRGYRTNDAGIQALQELLHLAGFEDVRPPAETDAAGKAGAPDPEPVTGPRAPRPEQARAL